MTASLWNDSNLWPKMNKNILNRDMEDEKARKETKAVRTLPDLLRI